ncbi:MAG: LysM peptidoglycan-binding domain-containing protein [Limisphaerales bacterium]
MKRLLSLLLVASSFAAFGLPARAEDSADTAAAIAERQAAEERYKRLNSAVEDLVAAHVAMEKRLNAVVDELRTLREDVARANSEATHYASREEFDTLARKLKELDEQRKKDRDLILDKIQELGKLQAVVPPAPAPAPVPADAVGRIPAKGYDYQIQSHDTLSAVIEAYRQKGVKVTLQQVIDANPHLDSKRLRVGQKIFIPDAALK